MGRNSKTPIYAKIYNDIIDHIKTNQLPYGSKLPGEILLSEKYKVNRATIRRALQELLHNGVIEKIHGKGSFVSKPKSQLHINEFISFTMEMEKRNIRHKTVVCEYTLLSNLDNKLRNNLELPSQNIGMHFLRRLRYYEDDPILLEDTYFPDNIIKNFNFEDLNNKSLYELFQDNNITAAYGNETYLPYLPNLSEKELLNIPSNKQVACYKLIRTLKHKNKIIEHTIGILKPGKVDLNITIKF